MLVCAGAPRARTEVAHPMELESQVVVSHSLWVLGTQPTLNHEPTRKLLTSFISQQ